MDKGILLAISAYTVWGFLPIYWKQLTHVPALQLSAHRIVWSCLLLISSILFRRRWQDFYAKAFNSLRTVGAYLASSILLTINWTVYVLGVNEGRVLDVSLGYFILPLGCVLLGVVFLRERLQIPQLLAVAMATAAVVYLAVAYGRVPWVALTLASVFSLYSIISKTSPLGCLDGLTLETALMCPLAVAYLVACAVQGNSVFGHSVSWSTNLLLIGSSLPTTIPLLLFAAAAKETSLSVVGLLEYISPTLQFFIGVFLYHEPFNRDRLIGFSVVWLALIIFSVDTYLASRRAADNPTLDKVAVSLSSELSHQNANDITQTACSLEAVLFDGTLGTPVAFSSNSADATNREHQASEAAAVSVSGAPVV